MKSCHFICLIFALFAGGSLLSQTTNNLQAPTSVNEDGTAPDTSAMLDVQSIDKGMLVPRMTTAQREAIASPANGLLVFDTETNTFWFSDNGFWTELLGSRPPELGTNSTAIPIPDCVPAGITTTITLSQPGQVEAGSEFKVCLDITHPRTRDLDIRLESPGGVTIDLTSDNGDENFTNTCFVSNASTSITNGDSPFTGYWRPEEPFSNFIGETIAGDWKLKVVDDKCGQTGQLNNWSIQILRNGGNTNAIVDSDNDTKVSVETFSDEDFIRFNIRGSETMRIDTLGRIGMGEATPEEKLEVEGAVRIADTSNPTPAAGTIRWNPATEDFEGFTGTKWKSLTSRKFGRSVYLENSQGVASDGTVQDIFGFSVAISGDYAIVGASGDDDNGSSSGSAYIFHRTGSNWIEQDKLTASDGAEDDRLGTSVAISGDYAIVGASGDDDNGSSSGSAYIFHRTGSNWIEQDKLTASDGAEDDEFGFSVAISGDYVIVGANRDDDDGSDSGSAYIFFRTGTTWTEQAKLTASDGAEQDIFGISVAISGEYAIVGAFADDDNGSSSGSAYIFHRTGTTWTEQDKITASDGAFGDRFGRSVGISGDYAIVGASLDDDKGEDSGSAYVFQRTGSNWTEQAKITPANGSIGDYFGTSVAIFGDYVIVGAYEFGPLSSKPGSAYIFCGAGSAWTEQAKITASDGEAANSFGWSVSISGDHVIVGAHGKEVNFSSAQGKVYFFENE